MSSIPRGIRNNNPLNIRRSPANHWRGSCSEYSDPDFEQFQSIEFGIRAAFIIIRTYYARRPDITPRHILQQWAPASENNTAAYARAVSVITGFNLERAIPFSDRRRMAVLLRAMALVECGFRCASQLEYNVFLRAYDMV